jgi:glycerol transport system permease protein
VKHRVWIYLLPAIALLSINAFIPIIIVFNYSVHSLIAGMKSEYVGFGMYLKALNDSRFINALTRNFLFTFLVLIIEVPLGIVLAKILPRKGKLGGLIMVLLQLPLVIPWVTVGLSWFLMVRSGGIVPLLFSSLGLKYTVENTAQVFATAVICDVWHWTPLVILIIAAGYASMPIEPTEAAMIDRASKWSIFRHVELPSLRFPILMSVLLRFMDSFRVFDEPYIMFGDGPYQCAEFLTTNVYSNVEAMKLGYSAACSLIYLFLSLVIVYLLLIVITKGRGAL